MTKVSNKLEKVNESFTVYRYDNGYMLEVSGRDADNEYKYSKIMCSSEEELIALVQEVNSMPLDD